MLTKKSQKLSTFVQSDGTTVEYDAKMFELRTSNEGYHKEQYLKYIGQETDGTKIEIPKNLKSMKYMFSNTKITSLPEIPNSVEDISYAFSACNSLTIDANSNHIPNTVRNMSYAFCNCNNITRTPVMEINEVRSKSGSYSTYTGPEDLSGVFEGCSNLRFVGNIPGSAKKLNFAFTGTAIESCPDVSKLRWGLPACYMCAHCQNLFITGDEKFPRYAHMDNLFMDCQNISKDAARKFVANNVTAYHKIEYNSLSRSVFAECKNVISDNTESVNKTPIRDTQPKKTVKRNSNAPVTYRFNMSPTTSHNFVQKQWCPFQQPGYKNKEGKMVPGSTIWYDNTKFEIGENNTLRYKSSYLFTNADGATEVVDNDTDLRNFDWSKYIKDRNPVDFPDMNEDDIPVGKLTSMELMFKKSPITHMPPIPETVVNMTRTFRSCGRLKCDGNEKIPESVLYMNSTFCQCVTTPYLPDIPKYVTTAKSIASGVKNLQRIPNMPDQLIDFALNHSKTGVQKEYFNRMNPSAKLKEEIHEMESNYKDRINNLDSQRRATEKYKSNESDKSFDDGVNREIEREGELKPNLN